MRNSVETNIGLREALRFFDGDTGPVHSFDLTDAFERKAGLPTFSFTPRVAEPAV